MAWLIDRARGRALQAGELPLSGVVRLERPSAEQRAAAVKLVGRPRRSGSALRVDLGVVEEILRRGPWPAGLVDAVEALSGPVVDRRAEREREVAEWDAARDGLTAAAGRFPGLAAWWAEWCRAGGLKRAAGAEAARTSVGVSPAVGERLVSDVAAVLETLPAVGEPLAVLARRVVGDAHGLDASRPLGRLAAAVVVAAFLPGGGSESEPSSRDAWASAGVVLSTVSSTVLCLGVSGADSDGPDVDGRSARVATAAVLEAMRAARMPMLLTLDQVRSGGVCPIPSDRVVHVCENPTVVEVVAERWAREPWADRPGAAHPVVVCTSGQPSTAVVELLSMLLAGGGECRYHGDFDWPGLRIARFLAGKTPWAPWRYGAVDYRAAVQGGRPSRVLTGAPAQSPWDPGLAQVMAEVGLAVDEEAVAELLAADVLTARSVGH